MTKKYFYIIPAFFILMLSFTFSCSEYTKKEVVMYYFDSIPKLEQFYKLYGNKEYVEKEIRYYPTGIIMTEGTFNPSNQKHGKWVSYFENGKVWLEENYFNNMKDGKFVEYYKSNKKMYQGEYKQNLPHGKWVLYDEEGKKISTITYNMGEIVNEKK